VALGAVVSMSAVLLVFQYGQPRIFFAMARDGLLPQWAARVDQKSHGAVLSFGQSNRLAMFSTRVEELEHV
jgi:amino acid transporter